MNKNTSNTIKKVQTEAILAEITAEYLVNLYLELKENDIEVLLDGGWGVDALLEEQTREHNDIKIIIEEKDLKEVLNILEEKDFSHLKQEDTTTWNFIMTDQEGHNINIIVININDDGDGVYGSEENHKMYSIEALSGLGKINGQIVRCLTAHYQINSRTGDKPSENDFHDVRALCKKFEINLPMRF